MKTIFSECKSSANRFYSVAKKIGNNDVFQILYNLYPYVVNISFACELYLKAIRFHDDPALKRVPGGHELKTIFESLSKDEQRDITMLFQSKCSTDLHKFLVEDNRDFEDWRYAFEEEEVKANLSGLEVFAEVLHDYVEQL